MDLFSFLSPFVFCSFASGSSGNCYFVGKQDEGVLVDAGISALQIVKCLAQDDLPMSSVKAILVTHDHIDHVKGLEVLTHKAAIPIYAHSDCLQGIVEGKATKGVDPILFNEVEPFSPFEICGIHIEAYPVMHDGRGAMGYCFEYEGHTLTIATDMEMLEKGSYPYVLKQRISGPFGHLSNIESARFLAEMYHPDIKNIMLCHLSENNNTPDRALQCLYQQFHKKHVRLSSATSVFALPRHKCTGFVYL